MNQIEPYTDKPLAAISSGINLTEEQNTAVDKIRTWLTIGRGEFKLGGYAGTGKTTVIKFIEQAIRNNYKSVVISAFTGKAVNVLQKKGLINAQTLHSLIYNCSPLPGGGVEFHLKDKLDFKPSLIIVDEASMISTDLYEDLKSFNIPVLFVGDPGQLEPVGDNPNLMKEPDFVLSKIHRQAEDSPIIRFANDVRQGHQPCKHDTVNDCEIIDKSSIKIPDLVNFDQVICAKNKTRREINDKFRRFSNKPTDSIQVGDKLIILRNNRDCGVFNGMLVYVTELHDERNDCWFASVKDEADKLYPKIPIWKLPFQSELPKEYHVPKVYRAGSDKGITYVVADFGYCITCHKSQGSEWSSVLVWDEYLPPKIWDMKRWRYTAITRASQQLTYCL